MRPGKTLKLKHWESGKKSAAHVTVLAEPDEVRISAGKSFITVKEDYASISGGTPSVINIQGLSSSMRYAGMLQDSPFPLSLLPSTMMTPFPKQIIAPPFLRLLPEIAKLAGLVGNFVR